MKKFIEMLQTMTDENFETVISRIVSRQTICAFFSTGAVDESIKFVSKLRLENDLMCR